MTLAASTQLLLLITIFVGVKVWCSIQRSQCVKILYDGVMQLPPLSNQYSMTRANLELCSFWFLKKTCIIKFAYCIVASTNTCYYSENQIICFLMSWILTCRFFRKKPFLFVIRFLRYSGYLTNTWCVCQVSKRLDDTPCY